MNNRSKTFFKFIHSSPKKSSLSMFIKLLPNKLETLINKNSSQIAYSNSNVPRIRVNLFLLGFEARLLLATAPFFPSSYSIWVCASFGQCVCGTSKVSLESHAPKLSHSESPNPQRVELSPRSFSPWNEMDPGGTGPPKGNELFEPLSPLRNWKVEQCSTQRNATPQDQVCW